MNRFFQIFNFLGVCLLSGLCCIQWNGNRQFNLRLGGYSRVQNAHCRRFPRFCEQARTIAGNTADLDDFRHRLTQANDELSHAQSRLAAMTAERNRVASERAQLTAERDHLKTVLSQWTVAVSDWDADQANGGQSELAKPADDAI